ncbi:MAG: right-handed parallel beta-helix repeat-containing protein [bacterium]
MKKPRALFALFAVLIIELCARLPYVYSGTCVPNGSVYDGSGGLHGGPWTVNRSPYIIMSGTRAAIPDGETLTIEEGVVVLLNGDILIEGALVARGVTFTGLGEFNRNTCSGQEKPIRGAWGGLQFRSPDPGSLLDLCWIKYGATNISVTSNSANTPNDNLTISNCHIAFSAGDGIRLNTGGSPTVLNSFIHDNAGVGLRSISSTDPVIENCAFMRNGNTSGTQIDKYPLVAYADNVKNFSNLSFSNNAVDAIWVGGESVSTGTWQDHGVPYHVSPIAATSNVLILDGETLTLAPGVDIRLGEGRGLNVQGALVADGDSCRFITIDNIDPNDAQHWGSLLFSNCDPGTILNYCDLRDGGYNSQASVSVNGGGNNFVISNSRITGGLGPGIGIQGIAADASPSIFNNLIENNAQQGVRISSGAGSVAKLRCNLITKNNEGIRLANGDGNVDLGHVADPGHNAFVNNTGFELYSLASRAISAIGNYWVDADSAVVDQNHVFDNDELAASGRVVLNPVDLNDQSRLPQTLSCPPNCATLNVIITAPTSSPNFQTTSRLLTLGGTAADNRAVTGVAWANLTTGASGVAALSPSPQNLSWSAPNIPLIPGQNLISLTANDGEGCVAGDQIIVTLVDAMACWENDSFDNLTRGSLDAQNGWITVRGRAAATVIANQFGTGQVMQLDAPANQVAIMEKNVSNQTAGVRTLEFQVLVQPSDTSMAKIEIRTTNNPNWDKKFQLYFGTSMRLNYGPTQPEAMVFLAQTEPLRWYHVQAVIDLDANRVDLFLDGVRVLDDIAVGAGPITRLSVSGFDYPGYVLIDDLRGCQPLLSAVESHQDAVIIADYQLAQNYPNPFNPETSISYQLPKASQVSVTIYNLVGQRLRTLVHAHQAAGNYRLIWNGKDEAGEIVPSGTYLCRLQAGDFVQTRKMSLLR